MGLWAAGHAAGLIGTLESLPAVWAAVDRSPLGSAAGYGVPLSLDRGASARALGFAEIELPVTAVQNGRGKLEAAAIFWCVQLGHDLAKAATDVILFSSDEYGYLSIDPSLATGSSLMPHKRNPDLFELARARAATLEGELACVLALRARLASGYHRDFQMMKEPLFRTVARAQEALEMLRLGIEGIRPDPARCSAALGGDLLATGAALSLAASGTPFREAYRTVAASLALAAGPSERHRDPVLPEPGPTPRRGGPDAGPVPTGLAHLTGRLRAARRLALREERRFSRAMARLAGGGTFPAGREPWRVAGRA